MFVAVNNTKKKKKPAEILWEHLEKKWAKKPKKQTA